MKSTEKIRVSKGEWYWFINSNFILCTLKDDYSIISNSHYNSGNYFSTQEEAETILRKLRSIIRGADVIETPSEEEISKQATDIAWNRQDDYYDEEGNVIQCYGECYDSAKDMYKWLKSKIVK